MDTDRNGHGEYRAWLTIFFLV